MTLPERPTPHPVPDDAGRRTPRADAPSWETTVEHVRRSAEHAFYRNVHDGAEPADSETILYIVTAPRGATAPRVVVEIARRVRTKAGTWGKPKTARLTRARIERLADPADRRIVSLLAGAAGPSQTDALDEYRHIEPWASLPPDLATLLLPMMAATGRLVLRAPGPKDLAPVRWDDGPPWAFRLVVRTQGKGQAQHHELTGWLCRGEERVPVAAARLVAQQTVFFDQVAARLDDAGAWNWLVELRRTGRVVVPADEGGRLLERLSELPELPPVDLPEGLQVESRTVRPVPTLHILAGLRQKQATAVVSFDYAGRHVPADDPRAALYDTERRVLTRREPAAEREALEQLQALGFRRRWRYATDTSWHEVDVGRLPRAIRALVLAGWRVEAEGKLYRSFSRSRLSVRSGIDWFELHGEVDFGDQVARLPELLKALSRGEPLVRLADGSLGLVPEEWLRQLARVAALGQLEGGYVRFRATQVGLLDALLAVQPEANVDAGFERARAVLRRFDHVEPLNEPEGFVGELRGYQREGLGWLEFLRAFGFGGCLADDMGLGKTVMVLALLARHRAGTGRPSLVVAPRSVVFNWLREAERFTPALRVAEYAGAGREPVLDRLESLDLLVTSYGTLRRDAPRLKDVSFDYVILDEAQAIKNAGTASAKAARLLQARHRVALSGTPVENHLGELWSIFEFLNPGMLGSGVLTGAARRGPAALRGRAGDETADDLPIVSRALRPFILRRTKQQVAGDLPPRQEETLWCELSARERRHYDELREHYRATLLGRIDRAGLAKSKLHVLEALLRLRQAACHPGLLDPSRAREMSAKLETLLPQLDELREEGHKALVFSQFTSLLAILRHQLDAAGVPYEYLDGHTRDREARVRRFQDDAACPLFLISLKAGGLGLNLTAAEYVFLLDPWWNPATEAQAIDRTHRIGQTRPVFAYRLIARDTVEERILDLQRQKRDLAEAIISEDHSIIANLTREELERLLA